MMAGTNLDQIFLNIKNNEFLTVSLSCLKRDLLLLQVCGFRFVAVIQHPPASFHSGFFFFFNLPFVCWDLSSFIAGGEGGEGGRKAEGSSEDFCATITFTLGLCNFLLTPLPPTPPLSLAFNWQSISDIPPLYYVNDHPPPPKNNVISPLKSSKPLPSPPPQVINEDWLVPKEVYSWRTRMAS